MLWFYRVLFVPVLLVLAPAYLLRMRRRGGYGRDFAHRFGALPPLPPKQPGRPRIWLQAVSVGEMLAIGPVLEGLRAAGAEVFLTTTTSTGRQLALDRYSGHVLGTGYFPLDAWPCSARAWRRIDPDFVLLAEGERWPEHLAQAAARGVPVLNFNARMSDRSYARLRRWPAAARFMFRGVTRLLACSGQDAARFVELGMPAERVATTGNIKLDVKIVPLTDAERAQLRRELGLGEGLVLLGSSTWPGEEAALLAAWRAARGSGVRVSLLLVPRHAERRGELAAWLAQEKDLRCHFRSRGAATGEVDVAVGDTTGELRKFTQLADLVFVGKSLAPHTEGQTPVEAAALARPMVFGPGMGNFRAIAQDLKARGAAVEVADAADLAAAVPRLLGDAAARARLAAAGAAWQTANGGAVARTLAAVREELARPGK